MPPINLENLEQRLSALEKQVASLMPPRPREPGRDDWRRTVGMFRGDPIAAEIIQEALRTREEERRQARAEP